MDLLLFAVGSIGVIVSLILLVINLIRKKPKKKTLISLGICFVLIVVGLAMPSSSASSDDNELETTSKQKETEVAKVVEQEEESVEFNNEEKELLKKAYSEFDSDGRTKFAVILEKYPNLNTELQNEFKADIERLETEKETWVAEQKQKQIEQEQKEWEEFVANNTKDLSAGEHSIGEHIEPGAYDVTFNGSGNFFAYDANGGLLINEIGGGSYGVPKYRAVLINGGKIELSGVSATFTPAKRTLIPYQELELFTGYWVVGIDVSNGRYRATALDSSDSGNFFVYNDKGYPKTNEILGGDYGVSEVVVNLNDGDLIQLSSLTSVKFTPED
jgi:uncharacterized FlaG/YvyC family protein